MINDAYMRTSFLLKTVGYNAENKMPVELIKRRKRAQTLNMLSIFFISVATLFSIHLISTFQATQSVPVAIRNIAKGSVIKQSDLHYVNVPKSSVFNNVLNQTSINNSSKNSIIAACNIKYGTPIFSNQVTKQTKIPPGFTTISVNLASSSASLAPGDVISIAFSKVPNSLNTANHSTNPTQIETSSDASFSDNITLQDKNVSLVHNVIVVNVNNSAQSALLAMPAENALQIINTQAIIPNLAVIAVQN